MAKSAKNLLNSDFLKGYGTSAKIEPLLQEGLKGKGVKLSPEWWDDFRAGIIRRHKKAKRS